MTRHWTLPFRPTDQRNFNIRTTQVHINSVVPASKIYSPSLLGIKYEKSSHGECKIDLSRIRKSVFRFSFFIYRSQVHLNEPARLCVSDSFKIFPYLHFHFLSKYYL